MMKRKPSMYVNMDGYKAYYELMPLNKDSKRALRIFRSKAKK